MNSQKEAIPGIDKKTDIIGLDAHQKEAPALSNPIREMIAMFGDDYARDAAFILTRLEVFAAMFGHDLQDTLRYYNLFIEANLEDQCHYRETGRYRFQSESEIETIVGDRDFCLRYLYALTLSTVLNRSRYELFRHYRRTVSQYMTAGSLILEIGSGNCLDTLFAGRYGRVEAYELNELSLHWRRILDLAETVNLKIARYEFSDHARYDFACLIELMEHVSDPGEYLAGLNRVLKEDGRAYCTFALRMPQADHLYLFESMEQCHALLDRHGFAVMESQVMPDTLMPFNEAQRWSLGNEPSCAAIYACLIKKRSASATDDLISMFADDLDLD